MSKHAKGKHSKPKAAVIFGKKSSKKAEEAESTAEIPAAAGVDAAAAAAVPAREFQMPDGAKATPAPVSFEEALQLMELKRAAGHKKAKIAGIVTLSVVIFLAAVYFAGVIAFSFVFMPNTHLANIDVSFKTPEAVQADFDNKVGEYEFKIVGHGLNFDVTSQDAGIDLDAKAMTDSISAGQNPWKWPIEVFTPRDVTSTLTNALSATNLSEVVQAQVDAVNATAKDPESAYITYDPVSATYTIVPEVQGTKLNHDLVLADIIVGAMNLEPKIVITADDIVQPAVMRDDPRLAQSKAKADAYVAANVAVDMGGTEVMRVDADQISTWVGVTPELDAYIDEEAMKTWAKEQADELNTVGSQRTYTRPDGKTVTVKGGDYGWRVDNDALAAQIADAVLAGEVTTIDVPVIQSGNGFTGIGGQDWGSRYIDVDISQQTARFYDGGNVIWESPVVTGLPRDGRATPQGVYDLNSKGKNVTLVSSKKDADGNPEYETPVTFWMPFKGNAVGFHDANWQPSFGGSRYLTGGSHGCVNLPYSKAEALYGLIQVGDVVVVHS